MNENWTFAKIWNESLDQREQKPVKPRDIIWASELGKPDIEIYLKLLGEEPTNPFNSRVLRKFEAGNIWEWIVKLILIRCGIYQESQKWIGGELNGCLKVSGKLDHIAGGKPNYEKARNEIEQLLLPDVFKRAVEKILFHFATSYPEGLEEKILEVKSLSSFGYDKVESTGKPIRGHDLQTFHYAKNLNKNASIVYICRDDSRMMEIFIPKDDKELNQKYEEKIKSISNYYFKKETPPIESPIIFDEEEKKFSKNFGAEYSSYLTKLYGVKDQAEFDEKYSPSVERWNRVISRIKEKKELTDNNKQAISEMADFGIDITNRLLNQNG